MVSNSGPNATRTDLFGLRREAVDPLVVCCEFCSISVVGSLMLYDRSLCYTSMGEDEGLECMSRQAASIPARSPATTSEFPLSLGSRGSGCSEAGEETDDEMARVTLELVGFVVNQTNLKLRLPWRCSRSAERAQRTVYGFWSKES